MHAQFLTGGIYAAAGLLLLLYTFGYLVHGVELILIMAAIGMMLYGFHLMGIHTYLWSYVSKLRGSSKKQSQSKETTSKSNSKK